MIGYRRRKACWSGLTDGLYSNEIGVEFAGVGACIGVWQSLSTSAVSLRSLLDAGLHCSVKNVSDLRAKAVIVRVLFWFCGVVLGTCIPE